MKLKIHGYIVNITARYEGNGNTATEDFLNVMSIAFAEAANHYRHMGAEGLAKTSSEMSNDIFDFLDNKGVYDDVKEMNNNDI